MPISKTVPKEVLEIEQQCWLDKPCRITVIFKIYNQKEKKATSFGSI